MIKRTCDDLERGTVLALWRTPAAPGASDYAAFTARHGQKLREAYPRRADGATLLPFRRLFVVARAG
jgi:trans-aconitate 2-methyltransferase